MKGNCHTIKAITINFNANEILNSEDEIKVFKITVTEGSHILDPYSIFNLKNKIRK